MSWSQQVGMYGICKAAPCRRPLYYCTLLKRGRLSNDKQMRTLLQTAQSWAAVTGASAAFHT